MNRAGAAAVFTAVLVVLAGCSAGLSGGPASPGDGAAGGQDDPVAGSSGSVNFYVSDRPGAMDDFEHLNVTVTAVEFHLVEREGNDSSANATTTVTTTDDATTTVTTTDDATTTVTTTDDAATPTESENESENESDDDGNGRWVVRDVNATTVDLTRLRGANATLVEEFDVPAGEYDRVVLEVSDVNGTLADGESTRVKLPSGKLQLDTEFEVENGSEVDFVYDVMVHKAGNSGKYILRPVLSESGTDQPIERVDEREDGEDEQEDDDESTSLTATLTGDVAAGENVTLRVTDANGSVANATVTLDGERVGTTDADGTLSVAVPADAEEVEIEVESGDREAELERELDGDDGPDDESDDGPDDESDDGPDDG